MPQEDEVDEVKETKELLLARLYDICVSLGETVEISTVTLDDGTQIVAIIVKNARHSEENGFEEVK